MTAIDEANRMLDTFLSVGATSFVVTKTDIHQSLIWGKNYHPAALHERLPAMVRTAAIRRPVKVSETQTVMAGENLIIRMLAPPAILFLAWVTSNERYRVSSRERRSFGLLWSSANDSVRGGIG